LLEKRPEDRPQSAESVLRKLDQIGTHTSGTIAAAAAAARTTPPVEAKRSVPRMWYAVGLVVVILAVAAGYLLTR